jgi:hypothetical protein
LAYTLARLSIKAGRKFPSVLKEIKDWVMPLDWNYARHIAGLLHKSNLCSEFPQDAFTLLDAVVVDKRYQGFPELKQCLDEILKASPTLGNLEAFRKLNESL